MEGVEAPSVVVGANEPATRRGIRLALEAGGLCVCAAAQSVTELMEAVERWKPEACLIDIELDGGGIRASAEIAARAPGVAVVLLAEGEGEEKFLDAMRAGAAGFLPKRMTPERLPKVIRAVLRGEAAVPRALVALLVDQYRERPTRRHLPAPHHRATDLTSREWEVLDFMRDGLSTREIAARLLISEVTVRRHIGSLLKKLRVSSRADALRLLETA